MGSIDGGLSVFAQEIVALELEQGDVLIYDNVLAGHGRMGSKPGSSRRVLVALAEPLPPES